ncbi:hypothetical protein SAMN05428944_0016 [Streptomyces sp. 1222.5]|uniref:DUF6247 family protein n=1 Tax=unclassified Streptomyces TaxID=2593676 RepID=UPI00089450F5|nr:MULTISPECIES: DUF6247 family protein [unclassified Streptomyces]PKW04958.1 hypothetical protein BX260_0013 [Streptomyces sp. 5112.2]SEB52425.1 hypothetical protein SAMN05428944_0016 [Streptomyces sp. 1222.5]SEB95814.1 hypothetical protein SAMN05216532_0022 [Streptomyces sp. 2231.1]
MSARPDHAAPPSALAPAAAAQLLAELRASSRAESWVPAFERDWAAALDDARHSYSLAPLHTVVAAWTARLAALPAVTAFLDSGMDDSDGIDAQDILGTPRE